MPGVVVREMSCPLCGSQDSELFQIAGDLNWKTEGTFTYLTCVQCGLIYLSSPLSQDQLHKAYPPSYQEKQDLNLRRKVRMVESVAIKGRLLDIGCGRGFFLDEMRKRGWEVEGVDFSRQSAEAAEKDFGLRVKQAPIEDVLLPQGHYDCITLWHTLEHLTSPLLCLEKVHAALKMNGHLVIAVPNGMSWQARFFGRYWYHLDAPRHLTLFSQEVLRTFLEKMGFQILTLDHFSSIQNVFGWRMSLLHLFGLGTPPPSQDFFDDVKHGRWVLAKVLWILFFIPAVLFATLESAMGRGGTIEVIARKQSS